MASIVQSPAEAQVFIDGVPGSHELVKDPGDTIFSTWVLSNTGDRAGFAQLELRIPSLPFSQVDIALEIPVGGRTLPGLFTNIPFTPGVVHSCLLIVQETDGAGQVIGFLSPNHIFNVTTPGAAVGPVLGIAADPDIQ